MEVFIPKSLNEAISLMKQDKALLFYGGTDVVPKMKRKQIKPELLISLDRIKEINKVEFDKKILSIGAGVKLQKLTDNDVMNNFQAIKTAAGSIATFAIRSVASIAGNILQDTRCIYTDKSELWRDGYGTCIKYGGTKCWVARSSPQCVANYQGDLAPALLIYDAKIILKNSQKERTIPLHELFSNNGKNHILKDKDEIIVKIIVPYIDDFYTDYIKLAPRDSFDFPEVGIAAGIEYKDKIIHKIKIAVTGISSYPYRLYNIEKILNEKPLTAKEWNNKIDQISIKTDCISATFYSTAYKLKMLKIYVQRLFNSIIKRYRL